MQTHLETPTGTRARGTSRRLALAGVALALALGTAIGLARLGGGDTTPAGQATAGVGAGQAGGSASTARRQAPPVVYLAATSGQAAYALRFSAELNALRAELGQSQVPVGALVVGEDATPALDGLPATPGTRFFDLRAR